MRLGKNHVLLTRNLLISKTSYQHKIITSYQHEKTTYYYLVFMTHFKDEI